MGLVKGKLTPVSVSVAPLVKSPTADPRFGGLSRESASLVHVASALLIRDDTDATLAAEHLGAVKRGQAKLKGLVDTFIAPLKSHVRDLEALFRGPKGEFEEAKRLLGAKLAEYQEAKEAAERERLAALNMDTLEQAEVEGTVVEVQAAICEAARDEVGGPIVTGSTTVKFREVLDYEVLDLTSVPLSYFDLSSTRLLVQGRAGVEVPGVRFYKRKVAATY